MEYVVRISKKARHLRITVHRDGRVVVTAPKRLSPYAIQQFITQKASWIKEKVAHFASLPKPLSALEVKKEFLKQKECAYQVAIQKVEQFNQVYQFRYKKISIRNQKTRWGSCSKAGNLSFNYKISLLPEPLVDYLVVHELCHLKEFNHGKAFWELVAKTIPTYKVMRAELKRRGLHFS